MRVLLVEDHRELATTGRGRAAPRGMAVDLAFDGAAALAHPALGCYDVVVLAAPARGSRRRRLPELVALARAHAC